MAVHSTRRIIGKASAGALEGFSPAASVTWKGILGFNQRPPEAPADVFVDGAVPAAFIAWEARGAPNSQGHLGGGIPAIGEGWISYTIFLQIGAGNEFIEDLDEEIRDLLDAVADSTGVVFVTEAVVDTAAFFQDDAWAAVTFLVPAQVIGDY